MSDNLWQIIESKSKINKITLKYENFANGIFAYETLECGFFKLIGRKIIQTSTKGRFEHLMTTIKLTEKFNEELWKSRFSRTGAVNIESNKFYTFEATQKYGLNIMNLKDRALRPSLDESNWGGYVYLYKYNENMIKEGAIDKAIEFLKKYNSAKTQYKLIVAIISQFPDKIANFLHKILHTKPQPQSFCSNLAISVANILFDLKLTPEQCQLYTPQEAIDYLFNRHLLLQEIKLCRFDFKRGIVEYNPEYFNIFFAE